MDAFYASVEQRDNPSLRGKPVIVGGHAQRGVVVAASYEVRPFGVRSAMPMARAMKMAPQAIVVPPRFAAYAEASEQVFGIFERYTPLIEPLSLDEAFLDVTASVGLFGTPAEIARRIRKEIAAEVSLPASAGIAPVKFVAKIASDLAKPNGQREIRAEEMVSVLAKLPASAWGSTRAARRPTATWWASTPPARTWPRGSSTSGVWRRWSGSGPRWRSSGGSWAPTCRRGSSTSGCSPTPASSPATRRAWRSG
jgi:nucleotidyltransferase/DNA polymerase involved in DNA repair